MWLGAYVGLLDWIKNARETSRYGMLSAPTPGTSRFEDGHWRLDQVERYVAMAHEAGMHAEIVTGDDASAIQDATRAAGVGSRRCWWVLVWEQAGERPDPIQELIDVGKITGPRELWR